MPSGVVPRLPFINDTGLKKTPDSSCLSPLLQPSMPVRSATEDALPRPTVKEPPQEAGCVCAKRAIQVTALCASVGDHSTLVHLVEVVSEPS